MRGLLSRSVIGDSKACDASGALSCALSLVSRGREPANDICVGGRNPRGKKRPQWDVEAGQGGVIRGLHIH